jgi:hypothetical protein
MALVEPDHNSVAISARPPSTFGSAREMIAWCLGMVDEALVLRTTSALGTQLKVRGANAVSITPRRASRVSQ